MAKKPNQLDKDLIEEVYIELREGTLEVKEIAKTFGISMATVTNLNAGKYYQDPLIKYPIRERMKGKKHKGCINDEPGPESPYWNHHYPESWDIRSE